VLEYSTSNTKLIITIEEGYVNGGLGTAIIECLSDNNIHIPVLRLGIPDAFLHHYGEQPDALETYGLQPNQIAEKVEEYYAKLYLP
jgi:deoxyxylulose-5-phosphate synthase